MANGVVFLPSYHEAIKDLPDSDRLQMYDAIVRYGLYGEIVEMSPLTKSLFTLIRPNIDSSQNRYRAAVENGKTGGRPRKNQTENQKINQKQNQDKDKDSDSDNDFEKEKAAHKNEKQPVPLPENARRQEEMTFEEKRQAAIASLVRFHNE